MKWGAMSISMGKDMSKLQCFSALHCTRTPLAEKEFV